MKIHSKLMEALQRQGFWQEGSFLRASLSAEEWGTLCVYEMGWEDIKILTTIPLEDLPRLLASSPSGWSKDLLYKDTPSNRAWLEVMGKAFITARLESGV